MADTFDFQESFQDLLLACLLRHQDKFSYLAPALEPRYFTGVQATLASRCVSTYFKKYSRFPGFEALEQLMAEETRRLPEADSQLAVGYVGKLAATDTADWQFAADNAIKFIRERAVVDAVRQSIELIKEGKVPADGFSGLFTAATQVGKNLDDLGFIFHADVDKVLDEVANAKYGVATGYSMLDDIWKRGWAPGWLIALLAPPKRWKTTCALNFALNITSCAVGEDVLYYSCEISQELAMLRALCNVARLPVESLYEAPEKFRAQCKERISQRVAANLLFKGFPSKSVTIADIRAHALTAVNQLNLKPRAIVIDYAETVCPSDKKAPEYRQQSSIYTEARALGAELGACVIMPDRCNRETVDKPVPDMGGFQGAFEKAGIVDIAIGICGTQDEYLSNCIRLFTFINRHGPAMQHFRGRVDPEISRIELLEKIAYDPEAADSQRKGGDRPRRKPANGPYDKELAP